MKAKDTAMKLLELKQAGNCKTGQELKVARVIALKQADISYKAGIKEVVDWIQSQKESTCMDCICAFEFSSRDWQDKLREWGINA